MLSFKVKEKLSDEELENLRIYVIGAAEAASEIEYDYERHMHHTFRASYEIKKPERTVQCKPLFTIREIEGGYQYDVEYQSDIGDVQQYTPEVMEGKKYVVENMIERSVDNNKWIKNCEQRGYFQIIQHALEKGVKLEDFTLEVDEKICKLRDITEIKDNEELMKIVCREDCKEELPQLGNGNYRFIYSDLSLVYKISEENDAEIEVARVLNRVGYAKRYSTKEELIDAMERDTAIIRKIENANPGFKSGHSDIMENSPILKLEIDNVQELLQLTNNPIEINNQKNIEEYSIQNIFESNLYEKYRKEYMRVCIREGKFLQILQSLNGFDEADKLYIKNDLIYILKEHYPDMTQEEKQAVKQYFIEYDENGETIVNLPLVEYTDSSAPYLRFLSIFGEVYGPILADTCTFDEKLKLAGEDIYNPQLFYMCTTKEDEDALIQLWVKDKQYDNLQKVGKELSRDTSYYRRVPGSMKDTIAKMLIQIHKDDPDYFKGSSYDDEKAPAICFEYIKQQRLEEFRRQLGDNNAFGLVKGDCEGLGRDNYYQCMLTPSGERGIIYLDNARKKVSESRIDKKTGKSDRKPRLHIDVPEEYMGTMIGKKGQKIKEIEWYVKGKVGVESSEDFRIILHSKTLDKTSIINMQEIEKAVRNSIKKEVNNIEAKDVNDDNDEPIQ